MISEVKLSDRIEYLSQWPDKYFDWAIDDPPYFSGPEKRGYYGRSESTTLVKRVNYDKTSTWIVPGEKYFNELIRVSKNQIIWGVNYYDFIFGPGRIVWDKVNGDSSFSDCELAYCSAHDSVRMFSFMWNGMMQGLSLTNGKRQQGNKKLNEKRIHPTQKPIALYKWLYETYATPGDKIIDCHVGSGSSRIAAYDYGCDFYGCELNEQHYAKQEDRFHQYLDKQRQSLFSQVI